MTRTRMPGPWQGPPRAARGGLVNVPHGASRIAGCAMPLLAAESLRRLELYGYKADAVAGLDPEQDRLAAELLGLADAGLDVGWACHLLALHLEDDVAGLQALGGGIRVAVDVADDDAFLGAVTAGSGSRERDAELAQLGGAGR